MSLVLSTQHLTCCTQQKIMRQPIPVMAICTMRARESWRSFVPFSHSYASTSNVCIMPRSSLAINSWLKHSSRTHSPSLLLMTCQPSRPSQQASRESVAPLDFRSSCFQLIHVPIGPDESPVQELGLFACSPDHECGREVSYHRRC